ncbi:NADPH oxidase 5 [Lepeophtheirus salmonis]|uniref:NADPH oxidase 5 n=1 Tax=Lepeophtheirus salmonis TaxID=72036 RepID=UPI001AE65F44|nr:NADPH oxidase 5-like [Lepeophtheirus salmonis]XP_040567796.1 NADPH oxidase 5-like [Lepeophtheirus salmonis]XP_040567797.1 NADPH oxidase 5-like [Lepeophtheirus salmonis]
MDVEEMMKFLLNISKPLHVEDFNTDQVRILKEVFQRNLKQGQDQLTMMEFKKIMPSKNEFFLERAFKIFDQDGSGTISMSEFFESINTFAAQGPSEKIIFLFKIYDIDGDGALQLEEIESIIRASLTESGMKLPESDIQALAFALYDEALGEEGEDTGEITIDQLSTVFTKHEGLLEGLNISLAKWLTPQIKNSKKKTSNPLVTYIREKLSLRHIRQNWQFFTFLLFLISINIILFVTRAVYFKDFATLTGAKPNGFYMMSRANGRTLLFNSMMILVLVLRYTITKMRDLGLNQFLPIDNNIYFHKVLGITSFIQAWFHTIMHLCNFSINVAPNPVKFVQLTNPYWKGYNPTPNNTNNWQFLGYQVPENCFLLTDPEVCPKGSLMPDLNVTYCQMCNENGSAWNIGDWIFTMKPGVFGIIGGIANPTGVALIIIFTIMFICSLPFVRKTGHFQVFYFTHLMYWAYFFLLILHAPEFWKWVIVPLSIYVIERLYRGLSTMIGQGKSTIVDGVVLPSRVTRLDINRPHNFRFNPGDWVFIRIPKIATYEWHPFTISSAPERSDIFTLHIRGVGQWTNRLYNFFEERKQEINAESRRQSMKHRHGDSLKKKNSLFINMISDEVSGNPSRKKEKLEIHIDGPFGAPASSIFRAEHAVLIATGIGVTPFSSILQSIMSRYFDSKRECPKCTYKWSDNLGRSMMKLRKVDFIWINRDQKSFEWFTKLLHEIELEQAQEELQPETVMNKFMDIHMYFTAALQKTDMRAVGLQVALDILHKKENRDLVTGLKAKTNAGRPYWNRVFSQLRDQKKGKITVFYCGNPTLAKILREKCEEFGFNFRKEVF